MSIRKEGCVEGEIFRAPKCLMLAHVPRTPRPIRDLSGIDPYSLGWKGWAIPLKFTGVDGCYKRLFRTALTKLLSCFFCQRKRSYSFTVEINKIANQHWAILFRWNECSGCSCTTEVENPIFPCEKWVLLCLGLKKKVREDFSQMILKLLEFKCYNTQYQYIKVNPECMWTLQAMQHPRTQGWNREHFW